MLPDTALEVSYKKFLQKNIDSKFEIEELTTTHLHGNW